MPRASHGDQHGPGDVVDAEHPLTRQNLHGMRPHLLALLPLLLSGCDPSASPGTHVDAGYDALGSGDPRSALAAFDTALSQLDVQEPGYLDARLGRLRALAYTAPQEATEKFLAFASSEALDSGDYRAQVTELVAAATQRARSGDPDEVAAAEQILVHAVKILDAGSIALPLDPRWEPLIKSLGDRATSLGAEDALGDLAELGYVGNDEAATR